ncbi:PREDICTED: uncharacterized protein LOC109210231 [Nicotiana attenuata]|uniref:uncharacterized protein LOC109210231 n=1 Tax=Nicotiana attenuata TaxID=49451 RepID=UPI0009054E9D|nr:PREDICTED: uncharacterized protein LOC109210231 [Nicotiana attenuata]
MVFAWLLNSLTREIRSSVIHSRSAHDLWKQLEKRYGQSNLAQLFELQKQLVETVQGSNNIATYFNNMKAIWDEIELLDARAICSCAECKCGALEKNSALEERQKLVQFLMELNESYTACRGNIMMMNPSPDIDRAYFLLLQEEMQRRNTANGLKNNQTQHQDYKRSTSTNLICRYCKKPGHTIEKCYKIHGYPLNFKNSRPRPFNNHAHSNATSTQEDTQSQASDVSIGIKQEQLNQLTELLQQVKFGQQGPSSSEANATANCAGPFLEEASSS